MSNTKFKLNPALKFLIILDLIFLVISLISKYFNLTFLSVIKFTIFVINVFVLLKVLITKILNNATKKRKILFSIITTLIVILLIIGFEVIYILLYVFFTPEYFGFLGENLYVASVPSFTSYGSFNYYECKYILFRDSERTYVYYGDSDSPFNLGTDVMRVDESQKTQGVHSAYDNYDNVFIKLK